MTRELDFFKVPKSVLLAEEVEGWRAMIAAVVPGYQNLEGVDPKKLMEAMLSNEARIYLHAESALQELYRFPEDIPGELRVGPVERAYITTAIGEANTFSQIHTDGILVEGARGELGFHHPNFINLLTPKQPMEAGWLRFVLAGYLREEDSPLPFNTALGFRAFLDAEDHFEDYRGKGPDELWLNRDDLGTIQSYHILYKGERSPTTPWEYMHRDDLAVIDRFETRISADISAVGQGVEVMLGRE